MKLSSIATALILSSTLEVAYGSDETWMSWLGDVVEGFKNATDAIMTTVECGSDWWDSMNSNPDLMAASETYENSFSYTESSTTDAATTTEVYAISYDSGAMAAYKTACDEVADSVWWELPSPTSYTCKTTDGSYQFDVVYEYYGDCWPTTDACKDFAEGSAAFIEEMGKTFSQPDSEVQCMDTSGEVAPPEPEPTTDDAGSTTDDASSGSAPPSDAPMEEDASTSEESSGAANKMTAAVILAAAAVMFV